jgi:hypothetical protein
LRKGKTNDLHIETGHDLAAALPQGVLRVRREDVLECRCNHGDRRLQLEGGDLLVGVQIPLQRQGEGVEVDVVDADHAG